MKKLSTLVLFVFLVFQFSFAQSVISQKQAFANIAYISNYFGPDMEAIPENFSAQKLEDLTPFLKSKEVSIEQIKAKYDEILQYQIDFLKSHSQEELDKAFTEVGGKPISDKGPPCFRALYNQTIEHFAGLAAATSTGQKDEKIVQHFVQSIAHHAEFHDCMERKHN